MSARAVVVAIAAVLGVGLAFAWIEHARRARDAVEARVEYMLSELDYAHQVALNSDELKVQLHDLEAMLADSQARLPSQLDAVSIERDLRARAQTAGVELVRITARTEEVKEYYAKRGIELYLRGPNAAVYAMLEQLAHDRPLRHIGALRMERLGDASGALGAAVYLEMYRYRDEEEVDGAPAP